MFRKKCNLFFENLHKKNSFKHDFIVIWIVCFLLCTFLLRNRIYQDWFLTYIFFFFLPVAVVVAFFLCWAPFHAQRLMAVTVRERTPTAVIVYTVLTHISGVTYYISATINPILYSIMSKKFREAFKVTLVQCCRKSSLYYNTSSSYTSVLRTSLHRNLLAKNNKHNNGSIQYSDISRTELSEVSSSNSTRDKKHSKVNNTEFDLH